VRTYESLTSGYDPAFQLRESDGFGGSSNTGILVPSTPTQNVRSRYMCLVAVVGVSNGQCVIVRGLRQYVTIGVEVPQSGDAGAPSYILEQEVTSPTWHFQDANISWHLMKVPPGWDSPGVAPAQQNRLGYAYLFSSTPAILYNTINMGDATTYEAAYGGRPPGEPLTPGLGNFKSLLWPMRAGTSWSSLTIPVEGPCSIALIASVRQTNPMVRTTLNLPDGAIVSAEDRFVVDFPQARYWRVAGSIIVEEG
jgi:hypothetical protein